MAENIRVNDIPLNERPVEKLLQFGVESLSNEELLAILLRTGTKGENVIALSKRLLIELDGLDGLLNVSFEEASKIKGIKKVKACQIIAMMELFNRFKTLKSQKENLKISSPKDVSTLLINEMSNFKQEVFKLILLNTKNIIIGTKDVFKGTLNSSIVHPREVFKEAVQRGSANIIVCHNHPSGDPNPSKEDIDITLRLKECGNIMGIGLLDHIIIGNNKYVSLKEKGII
ncbi:MULTISPECIES: DNA repair protein RadC [unclassified Clostridium]|uniref:RadC family protein n=1 Tax=Clostridium TaxID=1485 RepID=UPI001C8CEF9F|nr:MULTISPECIES: DNA repair protein RadC [unclassified Clostridium]MBX9136554.1 DNA repair protein RadC [Clostridium sp. K12(2020)]MBX9142965.1 DNA repair protein RadC [Clostridium sp. K13]MDU2291847.1 DNA repair protein RadC [Clostridium celatum]